MDRETNLKNQRSFVAAKKGQGLKRLILWVQPKDVDALKTIARQPHAIVERQPPCPVATTTLAGFEPL